MTHQQNTTARQRPRRVRWLAVASITAALAVASSAATAGAQADTQEPVTAATRIARTNLESTS